MKDVRDAMGRAGRSATSGIGLALGDEGTRHADLAQARARRRRAGALRVGAVGAGVALLAAGAWMLRPPGPLPATPVADATVGDPGLAYEDDVFVRWCDPSAGVPAYVPPATEGVTATSSEARDSGIEVSARIIQEEPLGFDPVATEEPPGGVVESVGSPGDWNDPTVYMTVTWPGDRLYRVSAAAYLVSENRLISTMAGYPADPEQPGSWMASFSVPDYDAATDTSTMTFASQLVPDCLGDGSDEAVQQAGLAPEDPAEIHTAIQVRDEDGTLLMTNVDAAGLDGITLDFPRYRAEGATVEVTAPTEAELVRAPSASERVDLGESVASAAAQLRDQIAERGAPFAEARHGFALARTCDAAQAELDSGSLSVLASAEDDPEVMGLVGFPDTLPAAALGLDGLWEASAVPPTDGWSTLPGQALFLRDPGTGSLVAAFAVDVGVAVDDDPDRVGAVWSVAASRDRLCSGPDAIAPGTYDAVMSIDGAMLSSEGPVGGLVSTELLQFATYWQDIGTLTVTD